MTRIAHVMGWIRTAKENLPAINHGRHAVAPEQIARLSALLDRMHRRARALAAEATETSLDAGVETAAGASADSKRAAGGGRRAA
jgi:hypothetical protein